MNRERSTSEGRRAVSARRLLGYHRPHRAPGFAAADFSV